MQCQRWIVCAWVLSNAACGQGGGRAPSNSEAFEAAGTGAAPPLAGSGAVAGASQPPSDMMMAPPRPPTTDAGTAAGATGGDGGSVGAPSDRDAALPESDAATPTAPGEGEYQTLTVDGLPVTVYLPAMKPAALPAPVVFALHGLSIPSLLMADITGLPAIADQAGFIAVFPEGTGGSWNTGGASCGLGSFVSSAADDAAYVQHILDALAALRPIDRARVFLSGFSMGGYGTNALGCSRPELFRALAPAAGGMPVGPCVETIPIMLFHGTADGTIGYDCGVQARDAWAAHNGCSVEVDTVAVMGGQCEWNVGCPTHGQVVLCSFDGMGHGWAGSLNPFAFGGPQFESASALMWQFFEDYL